MMNSFAAIALLAVTFSSMASAHIKMAFPVPFDAANLDTSPLQASGSDYPCKKSPYKITAMNKIPVDQPVLLDFKGTATHEGGTCQLSISLDKEPTADSTFKVIQVFEGGCPTAEGAGGLTFNVPKEFPNTERATLAWSWFNKIGNREMYMNCAPVEITGGSDSKDYYNSLPDMFKANIGSESGGCKTAETGDPIMPDPGQFLIKSAGAKTLPVEGCAAGTQSKQQTPSVKNLAAYSPPAKDANEISYVDGSGASGGSSPSAPGKGGGGNNGQYPQPPASPTRSAAGGNDGMYTPPVSSSTQPISTATSPSAPTATAPASNSSTALPSSTFQTMTVPASSATASAYPTLSPSLGQGVAGPSSGAAFGAAVPSGSASPTGSAGGSGRCTSDGAVVCNGPNQFGLCNHGSVVWQAVTAGTTCENGVIMKRSAHVRRLSHGAHKVRAA